MFCPVRRLERLSLAVVLTAFATLASAQTLTVVSSVAAPLQGKQWTISDDGHFVTAQNAVLRLKFAYNAKNYQGWFVGTGNTGGGGTDGGIVELYYKPTSSTRNLVFRNGTWGSGYDQMDIWEAEYQGGTQSNFDAPDYSSGISSVMYGHSAYENAGRLIATFDFQFKSWRIVRTYIVYPWGDITVSSRISVTQAASWFYLGHRFSFASSAYSFVNNGVTYNWGGRYRNDLEHYHAWTDGAPGGVIGQTFYHYDKQLTSSTGEVTYAPTRFGQNAQYSGFLLDDANGNDPDVVVFPGDRDIWASPFYQITHKIGGYGYIETALWNIGWAPQSEGTAQMTYFYMSCPSWTTKFTWPTTLGTWTETMHVMLRRGLGPADYLPLWKARARDLPLEAPSQVTGATASLSSSDKLYHLTASAGVTRLSFQWKRLATATNAIDYRTAFVIEGFDPTWVQVQGVSAPSVVSYYDPGTHRTLVVLSGPQPATPQTITVSVGK